MRAVAYPRVSSDKQREANTVASQLSTLPASVARRGWKLVRPVDHYIDDGRSARTGKLREREGFRRLLADAKAGEFDVVIIVGFDRLTRTSSFAELGQILGPLQEAGVLIADGEGEPLDLRDRGGRWMAAIKALVAADENEARGERTRRGRREAARRGRCPGKRPWGFLFDKVQGWRVDEPAAELVREMYARIVAGDSGQAIAVDFARRGVSCPQGGRWYRERVSKLIRATCYRGEWEALQGVPIAVPRIVDDDTWYAAQQAMLDTKRRGLYHTRHLYLLEGIAVCKLCSSPIRIHSSRNRDGTYRRFYICRRRLEQVYGATCAMPNQRTDLVDERVWAALVRFAARPDLLEAAASSSSAEAENWREDLRHFEARLKKLRGVEAGVVDSYHRGVLSGQAYFAELDRIARERRLLEQQIETARQQSTAAERRPGELAGALKQLRARAVAALTGEERRELVQAIFGGDQRVVLGPDIIEATALLAAEGGVVALRVVA